MLATQSALYSYIEALQGQASFGRLLDAGTGPRSLRWLMSLTTDSCTAVTGTADMEARVKRLVGGLLRSQDRLLIGDWTNPDLLAGEQFDTVIADHLLGAIEGSAPYFQTSLFTRLRPLTVKRLYVTGMEPYVIKRPECEAGALIWEIGRYRDACLILCGEPHFREYPANWVVAQLRRSGFRPLAARKFAIGYKAKFVNGQIGLCRPRLERLDDQALGQALIAHGEKLQRRALSYIESHGSLSPAVHYVLAADPV